MPFIFLNPYQPDEILQLYQLDQFISVLMVVEGYFSFLFKF